MASPYGNFGAIPDVGNIDLGKLGSKRGPDYVPYNAKGRDSLARVSFNTGIMWLGGYVSGGLYGFVEGWRGAASPNYKIRFNSVMNAFSKRGSYLGNSLGIIGEYHIFKCLAVLFTCKYFWYSISDGVLFLFSVLLSSFLTNYYKYKYRICAYGQHGGFGLCWGGTVY